MRWEVGRWNVERGWEEGWNRRREKKVREKRMIAEESTDERSFRGEVEEMRRGEKR